jgi:predicted Rossmann fold nucleotide-binding protein DprA/Smf involved in DNA uptake
LLKSGAEPLLHPDDVLALLELRASPTPSPALDDDAAACWDAVLRGASDIGAIARASGLSHRAAAGAVASLEIEGLLSVDLLGTVRPSPAASTPRARG